ncbi:Spc98 family-domain-containing protein [Cantharellus anzutake]|uniref:Spc98 family-domain-containing protein n=1 Tax=Cantharellus anzutake TaxID=1750568 RepID=UPI0019042417|nr:Spc98 family-domain-containing protein [Cantharellus anzutake]KAF8332635.1 Spc98 family-domain-containing protein [Cantharellus anzutake]
MSYSIRVLPSVEALTDPPKPLPHISPSFTLKHLGQEPEDPIIARFTHSLESGHAKIIDVGLEPVKRGTLHEFQPPGENIWLSTPQTIAKDNVLSWDSFQNPPTSIGETPYLSESLDGTFVASRFHVQPYIKTETSHFIHVSAEEFHRCMSLTLFGNSSTLFTWDRTKDAFRPASTGDAIQCILTIEAIGEASVSSILGRFLSIGAMLRRVEEVVLKLRAESPGSVAASFAHGLANIIEHMHSVSLPRIHAVHPKHLLSLWLEYEELEEVLLALASLCNRGPGHSPPFPPFFTESAKLTSRIYNHLATHVRLSSSHAIRCNLAYLLTVTSHSTLRRMGESIGLIATDAARKTGKGIDPLYDDDDTLRTHALIDNLPSFIPPQSSSLIDRARRSLELLRVAKPDHPACHKDDLWEALCVGWVWTQTGLEGLIVSMEKHVKDLSFRIDDWRQRATNPDNRSSVSSVFHVPPKADDIQVVNPLMPTVTNRLKGTFDGFKLFDLEPGAHLAQFNSLAQRPGSSYDSFIHKFPDQLPLAAPTLEMLMEATCLQPLLAHSKILSSSLRDLFLSDLGFLSHVDLLHRFLLMGDSSFASRLRRALFTEEKEDEDSIGRVQSRGRSKSRRSKRKGIWGVGLNPNLNDRGTWPPGGSELAFSLRRVIVDTLDEARLESEDGERRTGGGRLRDAIWKEGEWRLGFVIRPAEEDDQDDPSWLDPTTVHALDFLDMNYKPPETLLTLLSPELLEKYKRVFAFLLKLLRVDTVCRMLYRFSRGNTSNLCSRRVPRLALHTFAFQAQSFINSFVAYVQDCAIRTHHDAFTGRLLKLVHGIPGTHSGHRLTDDSYDSDDASDDLSDIFSVLAYHLKTMDDILEACLLKARHRTIVGVVVEECLHIILSFGQLISDVAEGKLEAQASGERVIGLQHEFHEAVRRLLEGLKLLIERGQGKRATQVGLDLSMDGISKRDQELISRYSNPGGNAGGFHQLLVRLDSTGWYAANDR